METSPLPGKSWQPSHEPPHRKGKQAPITLNKHWKEGGNGWGKLPGQRVAISHSASSTLSKQTQECLQWRAHGIPMYVYMQKPLTTRKHWHFIVDSIKLHLTTYKLFSIDIFSIIHLLNNWGLMTFITLLLQNINFHQYNTQHNTIKQKNVSTKMIVT